MLGKITKTAIDRLQPSELIWDADHREVVKGFGARRQRDGVFYCLRYRLNGVQYYKSIGRHGSPWTPDLARAKAKKMLGEVASGNHPTEDHAKVREAETFSAEVRRYLERRREGMKPRAYAEVERHLLVHAKPLHRSRLSEIDRRAIALRLAEIETAS